MTVEVSKCLRFKYHDMVLLFDEEGNLDVITSPSKIFISKEQGSIIPTNREQAEEVHKALQQFILQRDDG